MTLSLRPLTAAGFPDWLQQSSTDYTNDLVATGVDRATAEVQAARSLDGAFPAGAPSPDNAVFTVVDADNARVGYVWVGRDTSEDPASWWVWDVAVEPQFRGLGYGRESMRLAEDYARSHGAHTLGLSVFGFNTAARGLYESLGYETTSVKMRKALTAHD